jgi:four helix bundle protein
MRNYRDLRVWQHAHGLTIAVYKATSRFPDPERYGLTAQLRSSVISIEANIAEGAGRRTRTDYGRFLDIALGSINETECHLIIARDLGFIPTPSADQVLFHADEVRRMLLGLRRKLANASRRET